MNCVILNYSSSFKRFGQNRKKTAVSLTHKGQNFSDYSVICLIRFALDTIEEEDEEEDQEEEEEVKGWADGKDCPISRLILLDVLGGKEQKRTYGRKDNKPSMN